MNRTEARLGCLLSAVAALCMPTACADRPQPEKTGAAAANDALDAARRFSSAEVRGMLYGDAAIREQGGEVPSMIVRPHWIGDDGGFWYEFRDRSGYRYVVVAPSGASREPLFDHPALAAKLSEALGRPVAWRADRLRDLSVDGTAARLSFTLDGRSFEFDRKSATLRAIEPLAERLDADELSVSPDGRYAALVRGHDLYVRDLEDHTERRLTDDGERWYSFARDFGSRDSQKPLAGHLTWLPGSRRFVVERWDNRRVGDIHITDWTAAGRAVTRKTKFAMPGDEQVPAQELWLFDAHTGEAKQVDTAKWPGQFVGHMDLDMHGISAAPRADDTFYFTRMKRGYDVIELLAADTENGTSRVVLRDASEPYLTLRRPVYAPVDGGRRFLWLSDRGGWNHFYRYGAGGELEGTVTSGRYVAERIAHVDRDERLLYFSAFGREPGLPPYYRQYYRVPFDGGEPTRLTPEDAIHEASFSPQGRYFVDNHSRADAAPVAVLRDRTGALVMELERLDTSALERAGFRPPERFSVTAADGETALYGIMWKPFDFDPASRYPLIGIVQPNPGHSGLRYRYDPDNIAVSLAQLGFVVVEARTRGQGRHVRNREHVLHSYGNPRDYPLADARATVEQLVERHAFIDGERVGVYGHSGGGFMAASLILTYPDLFDAAVSASGNHENELGERNSGEYHWGVMRTPDGDWTVDFPGNAALAERLTGHLLLLHGAIDRDTHVGHTLRLAQALQRAGKRFDMMIFPAEDHGLDGVEDYYQRVVRAYFAEHLLGAPPASADLGTLTGRAD